MKKEILCFEHESMVYHTLGVSLEKSFIKQNFTLTKSLEEFFRLLEGKKRYDLIICNDMIPILDENVNIFKKYGFNDEDIEKTEMGLRFGEVLSKNIREIPTQKNTPILFLTYRKRGIMKNPKKNIFSIDKTELSPIITAKICDILGIKISLPLLCPFCGYEVKIEMTDREGNFREPGYFDDPWSGVSYNLTHPYTELPKNVECPISTHEDEFLGHLSYESLEEIYKIWKTRHL